MQSIITLYTAAPRTGVEVVDCGPERRPPETQFKATAPLISPGGLFGLSTLFSQDVVDLISAPPAPQPPAPARPVDWVIPSPAPAPKLDTKTHHSWIHGHQLKVELAAMRPLTLRINSQEPARVVSDLLGCSDPSPSVYHNRLKAFTSQYGFLTNDSSDIVDGYRYGSVGSLGRAIRFLTRLRDHCHSGDGAEIRRLIVENWGPLSKTLYFEPRFDEATQRLVPELVTPSLFSFCVHELIGVYFVGAQMTTCAHCGTISIAKGRADKRYCSVSCRKAASRQRRAAMDDQGRS